MTELQIERNRAFIRDLRANEKKAKTQLRDGEGGRCCLCVALDTANALGADFHSEPDDIMPPHELAEFYGWDNYNPVLKYRSNEKAAAWFNDGNGCPELSHPEIADAFEATFPEIKA